MVSLPPSCPQSKRGDRLYILMSALKYLVPKKGKNYRNTGRESVGPPSLHHRAHPPQHTTSASPGTGCVCFTLEEIIREPHLAADLSHVL